MATGGSGLDGGDGTAHATATGGTVNVQSYATASGGLEQMNSALDHAGTATAEATGTDAGGFVTAQATSNLNNQAGTPVSTVSGTATAMVAGTSAVHAVAGFNQQGSFDTSGQAIADVIGLPSAPMAGTDVAAGQTLLFDADQGSAGVPGATGSHTTTTTINATVDLTSVDRGSEFLLDLHQATVIGGGVTGVTFDVTDIATPIHKVFTNAASAGAYFTDDVLDLGSFDTVTGDSSTLFVQINLAVTTDDANSGFFAEIEGAGTVACFRQGTRIRTARGEITVESLCVGDLVPTAFSGVQPVKWLATRSIDCRRHPRLQDVWPVRVQAGAFKANQPVQDMFLSPDHAVFVDGVLIPIRYLINDTTIRQEEQDIVAYWHVELERHDVLLAEGLPCESYLDTGNRGAFANGGLAVQLHPDFAMRTWEAKACAPLVLAGAELVAARSWLLERAELLGHAFTRDPALRAFVDGREIIPEVYGARYRFHLPTHTSNIRLVSRSAVPAHVWDEATDHRWLGVAISRIVIDGQVIALADTRLTLGWYNVERDAVGAEWRWTDGDATVETAFGRVVELDVVSLSGILCVRHI